MTAGELAKSLDQYAACLTERGRDTLTEAAARLREAERLASFVDSLATEVEHVADGRGKRGMGSGVYNEWSQVPPSVLAHLRRVCRAALAAWRAG